ncbi:MAG: hypothetical protein HY554_15270, partial [Elusimicrobia bacterium]|nr:hypothetical protein [Elusimicrobiota bacterium]
NWYIGFNNAWIVELPPAPIGEYSRAFIGAKIGRAKTRPKPGGRHWEREVIPGKVYIGISPTPSFSPDRSFFLAETADIPLEDDPRVYIPGTGSSQWFWAEVPAGMVSFSGPNYLIVWSPTRYFVGSSSAPILAAFEERAPGEEPRAWNNRSIGGVAPRRQEGTLETPIANLKPAIAIKLVPPNDGSVAVHECWAKRMSSDLVFRFSVEGESIESAWLESSADQIDWERFSRLVRQPPFQFTLAPGQIPQRGAYVRAVARDQLHNEGACDGVWVSHERQ